MSAYTAAYTDIRTNDTTRFRAQGKFISDSIESTGWVKTADTGQIDWTTVAAPGAADTAQGYEIRDSGKGLAMKVEYGSGFGAYSKALWLTVGTGSDGAGTITGLYVARLQLRTASGYSGGSARAGDDFISGTVDRLMVAMTDDTDATWGSGFVLQKAHDPALTEDSHGWWLFQVSYNLLGDLYCVGPQAAGFTTGSITDINILHLPRSVGDASNIPVLPCFAPHPLYGMIAMRDMVAIPTARITHQATATIDGRTYVSIYGATTASGIFTVTPVFNHSVCLRYD